MLTHKGFRFRIYPTPAQEKRLGEWERALRFLWNLAHEQRLMGLARTDKRHLTAFDQHRELTDLRSELPWLADVPRGACESILVDLDKGWQRCFKKLGWKPRWKTRFGPPPGVTEEHSSKWRLGGSTIRFPKLGNLQAVTHRQLEGKPKSCALRRDGNQWFACIMCEVELTPPVRIGPVLGIDRGITDLIATSDGERVANPRYLEKAQARLARAQRVLSRRKKGSNRRAKAKHRVMVLHRKVRRQRDHHLHVLSARYAKSHGVIVVENLNVAGMVQGNLGRQISDAGWSRFASMLKYKLEWSGGRLVEVPAAYTSQTCFVCGVVDRASRSGKRFCCTACGHSDDADLNAALNIKARGNPSCMPVDGSLLEGSGRSGKPKVKLRTSRKRSSETAAS